MYIWIKISYFNLHSSIKIIIKKIIIHLQEVNPKAFYVRKLLVLLYQYCIKWVLKNPFKCFSIDKYRKKICIFDNTSNMSNNDNAACLIKHH